MRKINNIEDHNKYVDKTTVVTIITFRNQQLLDLWINEFQGQISDGMWENSRHTEWLWKNTLLRLGNETKVEVWYRYHIGRKSFGMTKDLWDVIGDRILDENGFETEKEGKAAWREIATAIYNATESLEVGILRNEAIEEKKQKIQDQWPELRQEWLDAGVRELVYSWGNMYDAYIDPESRRGFVSIEKVMTRDGGLKTAIGYKDQKWTVGKGNVKAALEALRTFVTEMENLK